MIRLLHLADVHLGRTFQMLGDKGAAHRRQVEATLRDAVALAVRDRVDLVIIAGDLFEGRKPSRTALEVALQEFRTLADAGIRAVIIAGNHDATADGRVPYETDLRQAHPGLISFGPEVQTHPLPELDLLVIGRSATPGAPNSPLAGWPRGRTTRFAVGVAHGSVYRPGQVEGDALIHPREIRELNLDYLALGDWHSAAEVSAAPATAWYAGAPEMLTAADEGAGHVLRVDIAGPNQAAVTPVRVGRRRYQRLEIDAQQTDDQVLRQMLAERADPDLMCDVVLTGLLPVDRILATESLRREFSDRFFRFRVENRSRTRLDDEALAQFGKETVLGRFVALMRDQIDAADGAHRQVLEEALQVGVAVLQTGEVPG